MHKILELLKRDQEAISFFKKGDITPEEFKFRASKISEEFFDIYKKHGFPYKNENSGDVYKGAVVLSLHQPLENLEIIFNDIEKLPSERVDPKDLAFMTDKIRVIKGEKQIYGTQYKIANGNIEFLPIENPNQINQKRKEAGLETLEEYEKKAKSWL
jgi:hypothetical protein